MVAVDTNVVVRLLANDHPAQVARAAALFRAGPVFVATTVLLETAWVLRHAYAREPGAILPALRALAGLPQVTLEDPGAVADALRLAEFGVDFADALHVAAGGTAVTRFASFDAQLVRRANGKARVPVTSV